MITPKWMLSHTLLNNFHENKNRKREEEKEIALKKFNPVSKHMHIATRANSLTLLGWLLILLHNF